MPRKLPIQKKTKRCKSIKIFFGLTDFCSAILCLGERQEKETAFMLLLGDRDNVNLKSGLALLRPTHLKEREQEDSSELHLHLLNILHNAKLSRTKSDNTYITAIFNIKLEKSRTCSACGDQKTCVKQL